MDTTVKKRVRSKKVVEDGSTATISNAAVEEPVKRTRVRKAPAKTVEKAVTIATVELATRKRCTRCFSYVNSSPLLVTLPDHLTNQINKLL